jgi:glycogen synthase
MRVLTVGNMYPPHHLGGYELVWRSAVEHLRARGHEVSVLTTGHRQDGVDKPDPAHVHRDLRWWWRDHGWPRFGPRARLAVERHNAVVLGHRLQADAPEVVAWFAMGGMSLSMIERVRRVGLPAVGVVHDDWLIYGPRVDAWLRLWTGRAVPLAGVAERLTGIPTRVDLPAAATWLFVSDYVRRAARERGGLVLPHTGIAHSGIDARIVGPLPPARAWGGHLLCVGRIDPRKGLDTAIRALARLTAMRLSIAGEGDPAALAALRDVAAEAGVEGRVAFLGFREGDALAALYRSADAVLFPVTWEEPWGLVPLEAMAHGVPVVATGSGGSGEYLREGVNALITVPGDPCALAAAVERLAGDPPLRERLRVAGASTAARHTDVAFNDALERALQEAS